jgi:hypothetical protein
MIGHERATRATLVRLRPEHKVVDDQLAAPGEEVGERHLALGRVEEIILLDLHPRQGATLDGQSVAQSREFFFFAEQFLAGLSPFLLLCVAQAATKIVTAKVHKVTPRNISETNHPVKIRWSKSGLTEPQAGRTPGMQTAIIIASGRSIRHVCLPLFRLSDAKTISVNKAVHYADFSDYVFTLDTLHLNEGFNLPLYAGEKIAAVPHDYGIAVSGSKGESRARRPDVRYLDRVPFSKNDPQDKIMTGCSGFGAYQFAYKFLGAKRVFLFGCDHDDQGAYFYGEERNARHNNNWNAALTYWNEFTPPEKVESWNVSPTSSIESLPKISWNMAFRMLDLPPIPVVTVLKSGGEFHEGHVEWLQRQVKHPIICLTDSKHRMNEVISIPLKHNWPGWWSKIEMFRDDLCLGNFLYADLATVFLDGIPSVFQDLAETHVLSDMCGHPWIQSSLMLLHQGTRAPIWNAFISNPEIAMREAGAGGDQIFLNRFLKSAKRFQEVLPRRIISYKADVLKNRFHKPISGDLRTAQVVCFHGQPRPWDVNERWVPRL